MADAPPVSDVRFVEATEADRAAGLLGWVSCRYGDLVLDGNALRRTLDGRYLLTFPSKKVRGREWPYIRPVDDQARRRIERAVFEALGLLGVKP